MSKTQEKAEGFTRQVIGQMIGDDLLVQEGKELEQKANQEVANSEQHRKSRGEQSEHKPSRKDEGDS